MKFLLYIVFLLLIASCTRSMHIVVMHPAQVEIPEDLDSVLIVDRTKVAKGGGKQIGNVLEGVLTGEPIAGDKYGRKGCVENLEFLIAGNERLTLVHREVIEIPNTNGNFDNKEPLRADFLDSICLKYGADGVIALEHFDSDRAVNNYGTPVGESFATTKWRLYYPNDKSIVDNFGMTTYGQGYRTSFFDPPMQYKAIYNAGAQAADVYIKRIVPAKYNETRMYYTTGSKEMKIAAKHVANANWSEARFMYENVIDGSTNPKLLGKAAYNLAVISELEGNLDMAVSWIQKSARSGNRSAPNYNSILNRQINEKWIIENQLKRK